MSDQPHPEEEYMSAAVHPAVTRVRVLQAQGWSLQWIADQLGVGDLILLKNGYLSTEDEQRLVELYERVGDRKGPCQRSAKAAKALGAWPAIHYDDDMVLLPESIPGAAGYHARGRAPIPHTTDPERYRRFLVLAALTVRDLDYPVICHVFGEKTDAQGFKKQVDRIRRELGLRMRTSTRQIFDTSRLMPEQEPLHRAVLDHVRGIEIFEMVDELDDPGLDYQALWHSLCDAADLLMGAGAAAVPACKQWPTETHDALAATLTDVAA